MSRVVCFCRLPAIILVTISSLCGQSVSAQDDDKLPVRMHGFLLGNFTARMNGDHPPGAEDGRLLLADTRLRLEVSGDTAKGNLSFLFKGDVFHDAVVNDFDGLVREAYVDFSQAWLDVRAGRQVVTWGVGDLLFINDVFPKDWTAFFSGRPLEYLKLGVDAAKLHLATGAVNAELILIPFFQPDNLPAPERFFFFDPFSDVRDRVAREPTTTAEHTELALRFYRRLLGSDISFYAYRGFWRQPSFRPDALPRPTQLLGFYPRLDTYGVSAQRNVGAALLNLEAGYYDSRDDRNGTDPAIPNSQFRFLVGYQRQLATELTLGAQYYVEIRTDYPAYESALPAGLPAQDRTRHVLSLRLTQFLNYQTWKLSLFSFYSPSDQDLLLIPEVWHTFTDRFGITVGANIFEGERQTTFLGQMDRNDNLYVALRFDF